MLYPLWTAKPGSGCTTTALALAGNLAARWRTGVLLVDLSGDLPAASAVPDPGDGVTDWLAAETVGPETLPRLEVELTGGVSLLPVGRARQWGEGRDDLLIEVLNRDRRAVVCDVGTVEGHPATSLQRLRRSVASVDPSFLVTRPCYLGLRRAMTVGVRPTGVVLLREPGREIDRASVAHITGAPVVAQIDQDAKVARAVDAGRLLRRLPRAMSRQVGAVAP